MGNKSSKTYDVPVEQIGRKGRIVFKNKPAPKPPEQIKRLPAPCKGTPQTPEAVLYSTPYGSAIDVKEDDTVPHLKISPSSSTSNCVVELTDCGEEYLTATAQCSDHVPHLEILPSSPTNNCVDELTESAEQYLTATAQCSDTVPHLAVSPSSPTNNCVDELTESAEQYLTATAQCNSGGTCFTTGLHQTAIPCDHISTRPLTPYGSDHSEDYVEYCMIENVKGLEEQEYFQRGSARSSGRTDTSDDSGACTDSPNPSTIHSHDDVYITAYQCERDARNHLKDDIYDTKRKSKDNPGKSIEYMVEVYTPTIAGILTVGDILDDLRHVIGDAMHDEIDMKICNTSRRELVHLLLHGIKRSDEPGKWQTFLNALRRAEYIFLYKLLQHETENDHFMAREILSIIGPNVSNKLHIGSCLDKLYANSIISEADKDEIERVDKHKGPIAATRLLLKAVPRRSLEWVTEFNHILKDHGLSTIANLLIFEEDEMHECQNEETCAPANAILYTESVETNSRSTKDMRVKHEDLTSKLGHIDEKIDKLEESHRETKETVECMRKEQRNRFTDQNQEYVYLIEKTDKLDRDMAAIHRLLFEMNENIKAKLPDEPPSACVPRAFSDSGCADVNKNYSFTDSATAYVSSYL